MANKKAVELLKNSPYKDKLQTAGLFLKELDSQQKALPALINSRLGNKVVFGSELQTAAPELKADKVDQISALPIGARLKIDPWSDQVELLKSKPVALTSAREKMPFEVTPFMPFLTRYEHPGSQVTADSAKADLARQQSQAQPQQDQQPQQAPQPQQ